MTLTFRNLTVSPEDPVERWGFEGLLAAVERGDINHWHRIAEALARDPRGKVAVELAEVSDAAENPAIPSLLQRVLQKAVEDADTRERQEVADELQRHLRESGLSRADFAARLGTSQSRLSTYLSGKVVPSATILVRALRIPQYETLRCRRRRS